MILKWKYNMSPCIFGRKVEIKMKNKKGFTLLELVLVLALLGIVLSMIFSPIIFSFKNFDIQNEKANVISTARTTMDYLNREIRKSDEVKLTDDSLNNDCILNIDCSLSEKYILNIDSDEYKIDNRILKKTVKNL